MAVMIRSNGFGVRVHVGNGQYKWLGTYPTREQAELAEASGQKLTPQVCVVCGIHGADVHHIDQDRSNNVPSNLVYLCRTHHKRAHTGKLIWEALALVAHCDSLEDAHRIAHAALRGTVPEQRPDG